MDGIWFSCFPINSFCNLEAIRTFAAFGINRFYLDVYATSVFEYVFPLHFHVVPGAAIAIQFPVHGNDIDTFARPIKHAGNEVTTMIIFCTVTITGTTLLVPVSVVTVLAFAVSACGS